MDYQKLYARYNESKQYKDRWLALYKDLYFYVIPDRDAFNVKWNYRDDGKPVTAQVWDNTAVLAAYHRANDLHSLLLPKDRAWGKLVMDPHIFDEETINANKETMENINDRILFYLNQSNLSRVVSSSNLDLVGGTGAIWVESIDDRTPLYFRSIPAVCLYIEYSTDDLLNTCWFQCKMTGRQILDSYPKYRGTRYNALKEQPNDIYIIIFSQIKMSEDKFFIYAVLEDAPFEPLFEVNRSYPQIIIYRDRVRPGESDGRGIGLDMLPTIRDLNKIVMYTRQNLAFTANPPMFYDADSYFNPYSVRQWAGMMVARNPQGRNPLEALQMPSHPDVFKQVVHLQETIKYGFQVDPLGDINTPVHSATEISIRENRAQRTSSTDISRLINELPKQIFEVSAKILSERQLLSEDRSVKLDMSKKSLRFDFQTPLYDIQKTEDLQHFIQNMQIKQQFFGQGAAMATVKLPAVNEFLTNMLNLKHELFVTKEELMEFVKNASEMAQQGALPNPSTTASRVNFPESKGLTI